LGFYESNAYTIEKESEAKLKHITSMRNKLRKTGSEVAFDTREQRFKFYQRPLYSLQLGPGTYQPKGQFEECENNKKPNLLCAKSDRFLKIKNKNPGPGEY
jgi:hypothetical protein